ncbi:hypothetical protein GCM10027445_57610 [Amycolatopsis endophytica]
MLTVQRQARLLAERVHHRDHARPRVDECHVQVESDDDPHTCHGSRNHRQLYITADQVKLLDRNDFYVKLNL